MIKNFQNLQMTSTTSSLKVLAEGTGSLSLPSTVSKVTITNNIFHGYGSDDLIWQVDGTLSFGSTTYGGIVTPWETSDGQYTFVATLDSENLYISGIAQTAGSATVAATITYAYRILVP